MTLTKELKNIIAEAFISDIKECDIKKCDSCDKFMFTDYSHTHCDSTGKEYTICPECDLPEKWYSKYSSSHGKRFYVYFDPLRPSTSYVQWGHPTKGNPFHIPGDEGESLIKRKKQKTK